MKKGLFKTLDVDSDFGFGIQNYDLGLWSYSGPLTATARPVTTVSLVNETIQIDKHIDWFTSKGDYWENPDRNENGGVFVYKGGSLDVHITIAPTGTTTTFDLQKYSGWSIYQNGPNWNSSVSHSESNEVVRQHSTWLDGSNDTIIFRTDTNDHINSVINGVVNDQTHSTHQQITHQRWSGPLQIGSFDELFREEHDQSNQTDQYGNQVQHTVNSSYHETEMVTHTPLIGVAPDSEYHDGKG